MNTELLIIKVNITLITQSKTNIFNYKVANYKLV